MAAKVDLSARNRQLQETIEQQRAAASDLQNILNSSDLATICLDRDLNIRFFTPAARSLFSVIASDIGRPLADLTHRFVGGDLLCDARAVLQSPAPLSHEILSNTGAWYIQRTLPYRVDGDRDGRRRPHLLRHLGDQGGGAADPGRERLFRQHHRHRSPAADRAR